MKKLPRAQRRNALRFSEQKWPGRQAIVESYDKPADPGLNRSQHWSYAPTYQEAKMQQFDINKEEVDKTVPFFVVTLSNGTTSKKIPSLKHVFEWLIEKFEDERSVIPEKITIRQKSYGETAPKVSNFEVV